MKMKRKKSEQLESKTNKTHRPDDKSSGGSGDEIR
jgi:hypothetical protein